MPSDGTPGRRTQFAVIATRAEDGMIYVGGPFEADDPYEDRSKAAEALADKLSNDPEWIADSIEIPTMNAAEVFGTGKEKR